MLYYLLYSEVNKFKINKKYFKLEINYYDYILSIFKFSSIFFN